MSVVIVLDISTWTRSNAREAVAWRIFCSLNYISRLLICVLAILLAPDFIIVL